MYISTLTISNKGLMLLPKKVRDILGTNTITLSINAQNQIVLSPIIELGGALADYSTKDEIPYDEIRAKSWENRNKMDIVKIDDNVDIDVNDKNNININGDQS